MINVYRVYEWEKVFMFIRTEKAQVFTYPVLG